MPAPEPPQPSQPSPALPPDATAMLNQHAGPPPDALVRAVYDQLRAAAQLAMASERQNHTLAATALVHEAYVKLAGPREVPWRDRAHFYAAAAEAMRQILLDHAKARNRHKRGGGKVIFGLDDAASIISPGSDASGPMAADESDSGGGGTSGGGTSGGGVDFLALDAAMRRLEARDARLADVVRLKYYAGLSIAQVALVLGVSERTVKNDWAFARAWLERDLRPQPPEEPPGPRPDNT
jgi:RNA polymerase sigma-70 factor, ECF subfamily